LPRKAEAHLFPLPLRFVNFVVISTFQVCKDVMRRLILFVLLFISWASSVLPAAAQTPAGDPEKGKTKSATCAGCHGIPGWRNAYPNYNVPRLGGQHAAYIVSALQAYRSGTREHATMHAIAVNLTDEDMADLAAYFSQLVPNQNTRR
jgi:cytochrome c553